MTALSCNINGTGNGGARVYICDLPPKRSVSFSEPHILLSPRLVFCIRKYGVFRNTAFLYIVVCQKGRKLPKLR